MFVRPAGIPATLKSEYWNDGNDQWRDQLYTSCEDITTYCSLRGNWGHKPRKPIIGTNGPITEKRCVGLKNDRMLKIEHHASTIKGKEELLPPFNVCAQLRNKATTI